MMAPQFSGYYLLAVDDGISTVSHLFYYDGGHGADGIVRYVAPVNLCGIHLPLEHARANCTLMVQQLPTSTGNPAAGT